MPDFAALASTFELYRSFPPGVAEATHIGVRKAAGNPRTARVLDVGARQIHCHRRIGGLLKFYARAA